MCDCHTTGCRWLSRLRPRLRPRPSPLHCKGTATSLQGYGHVCAMIRQGYGHGCAMIRQGYGHGNGNGLGTGLGKGRGTGLGRKAAGLGHSIKRRGLGNVLVTIGNVLVTILVLFYHSLTCQQLEKKGSKRGSKKRGVYGACEPF